MLGVLRAPAAYLFVSVVDQGHSFDNADSALDYYGARRDIDGVYQRAVDKKAKDDRSGFSFYCSSLIMAVACGAFRTCHQCVRDTVFSHPIVCGVHAVQTE